MSKSNPSDAADAKPRYKFAKSVGGCLERLAALRAAAAPLEAQLGVLTAEDTALREHLLTSFAADTLQGARGSGLSVAVTRSKVPTMEDFEAFFAFAKKKGNEDLLPRQVNSLAWRERVEAGVAVPGVVPFERVTLRVTAVREKAK